ncbi:hypothetical protein FQN52_007490 [Onygenales sp. PD_12]|nr:hypothetical protein FQN53_001337 [Emmonsiellopsis sp. PD_33]KAK2794720.1 hypothetical protein FQN52_007490 [Onygenales sp. PD_12]
MELPSTSISNSTPTTDTTTTATPLSRSTTSTPIAKLSPSLPDIPTRHVRAVVILLWPFSSVTKQLGVLLSEPDFRLRGTRGQVKAKFRGPSAEAVAKSQIGIGDTVVLGLEGARWISRDAGANNDAEIGTPGRERGIEWDLMFDGRVVIEVYRDSKLFKTIDVQAPREEQNGNEPAAPSTPTRSTSTPQYLVDGESPRPETSGNWSSPAFSQRVSASFGSLSNSAYDPLAEEDGYIWGKGRKRTKFGRPSNEWVFVDTPPSPTQETADNWEDEEMESEMEEVSREAEQQKDVMMCPPSQGDTVPNSQVTVDMNEPSHEQEEETRAFRPPKLAVQTENMDSFTLQPESNTLGGLENTFARQAEGVSGIYTQSTNWNITQSQSQQPTITPFTSLGNSFEQISNSFNENSTTTPRLQPVLSPGMPIVSPLETALAGTLNSIQHSRSPLASQVYPTDDTAPHVDTYSPIVGAAGENVHGEGENSQLASIQHQELNYIASQSVDFVDGRAASPIPDMNAKEQVHVVPDSQPDMVNQHKPLGFQVTGNDQTPQDAIIAHEGIDNMELDEVWDHAVLPMPQDLSRHGNGVEKDGAENLEYANEEGIEEEFQEEIEEELEDRRQVDAYELEEEEEDEEEEDDIEDIEDERESDSEGEPEQVFRKEKISLEVKEQALGGEVEPLRNEGLGQEGEEEEEEEQEGEQEVEEEEEEEEEEDMEMYSDDEMPHAYEEASSQYDSDEPSDEESESRYAVESAISPKRAYPTQPPSQPEIIVLDSDSEEEGMAPAPNYHPQVPAMDLNGPQAAYDQIEQADIPPRVVSSVGIEHPAVFDEVAQQQDMEHEAETTIHVSEEWTGFTGVNEQVADQRSEEVQPEEEYFHGSPSFSPASVSDKESVIESDTHNEMVIDPELYQSEQRRGSTPRRADLGFSLDGASDAWHGPRVLVSPDSKGRLHTPVATEETVPVERETTPLHTQPVEPRTPIRQMSEDIQDLLDAQLTGSMGSAAVEDTTLVERSEEILVSPVSRNHADNLDISQAPPLPEAAELQQPKDLDVIEKENDAGSPPSRQTSQEAAETPATESLSGLQPNMSATGLRSRLSYFHPLSTLVDSFSKPTDTISVVISSSPISQATKGPREYFATLQLTDPSMSGKTISAQIFRRVKSSLPVATKGDVVLLRDFNVQSMNHKMMLLACPPSSWAVFPQGSDEKVQMNGPPVEFDTEESEYVSGLRQWFLEEGEELASKHEYLAARERERARSTETGSSVSVSVSASSEVGSSPSAATADSINGEKSNVFKKYAKPKKKNKKRHRRITIHELRDGRRYAEVGSPSDKDIIHELRDGTVYANL